ncbi:oxygenase MpaB family protein [Nocardia sp. AG03]|uniref:oxygenase MpaB family protein n=1 Tax=Nocardia sp. AG03 TaxID=3025312 RepID=UPI002418A74F|nr:oxygenase MpaB family protein [Nocardia sp. AG03]
MTILARPRSPKFEPADFDIRDYVDGAAAFYGATANVIMQLSLAPVGYGVAESRVHSGSIMRHPVKRTRTTLTYLSVALMGTDEDRAAFRAAVDSVHRHVRSTAESPVKYNAFDRNLQLWVAACLYWGSVDVMRRLHGPTDDEVADVFYSYAHHLGTTLQVPRDMWPADRAAFDAYWSTHLPLTSIDPTIKAYFDRLLDLRMLAAPIRLPFARFHRWYTTGLLPDHLRTQLGMTWTPRDERRLNRLMRTTGTVVSRLPRPIRNFPFNATLADMRRRQRKGKPLV